MKKAPSGFTNISTTYQSAYQTYDGNVQVRKIGERLWEVLPRGGAAFYEKSRQAALERAFQLAGARAARKKPSTSHARVLQSDNFGRFLEVRGPAVHLVKLPVGAEGKHGPITKYTPDWARLSEKKIADEVELEGARSAGHDIEGYVRLGGKRYSAFSSGGPDDFVIVVRNYKKRSA